MAILDVEETLQKLTIAEKASLLAGSDFWHTCSVKRDDIDIPRVRVSDGPNGIRGIRFFAGVASNCFPSATGLAASFDEELLYSIGQQMGEECRAKGAHVWLGPTLNIQRSPLGGRGFESYSEDPLLSGKLSAAIIRGCQSKGIAATPKHFVCNDQELDRNSNSSEVSNRALREIYLRPFQIALREGAPWALMTSYNKVNGLHASENPFLLSHILRQEWAWDGMTMSDWFGTYSTLDALRAGLDLEMPGATAWRGELLAKSVAAGKLRVSELDKSVRRVLETVKRAQQSGVGFEKEEQIIDNAETRAVLKRAACEAVVLIKNDRKMLPLQQSKVRKLAVIGPNAKFGYISGGGSASLKPSYVLTPLEAIKTMAENRGMEVEYAVGANTHKFLPLLDPLVKSPDGKEGCCSIRFFVDDPKQIPTAKSVYDLTVDTSLGFMVDGLPADKVPAKCYMRLEATFTPDSSGTWEFGVGVAGQADLYIDDKVVVRNSEKQTVGTLFFGTGTIEEKATIDLEAGREYKLCLAYSNFVAISPDAIGGQARGFRVGAIRQIAPAEALKEAIELAGRSDAVIVVAGLNADWESEGYDRPDAKLPPGVDEMIQQVLAANKNTAIVIHSGTQCEMPWANEAATLLQAFYGGNSGGDGIASVLFGEHNPSGKLPLTMPIRLSDYPSHPFYPGVNGKSSYVEDVMVAYRHFISQKPPIPVLASFGHGLSYTSFAISEPKLGAVVCHPEQATLSVEIEVPVKNTGEVDGAETIQCYVSAEGSTKPALPRPALELAAFKKVFLKAGETKSVKMTLDRGAFSYWDDSKECGPAVGSWVVEKGMHELKLGNSLVNLPYAMSVKVSASFTWLGL